MSLAWEGEPELHRRIVRAYKINRRFSFIHSDRFQFSVGATVGFWLLTFAVVLSRWS